MKLGYFTFPMHPPGKNYYKTLIEDRESIILADQLGFNEAFIGSGISSFILSPLFDNFS